MKHIRPLFKPKLLIGMPLILFISALFLLVPPTRVLAATVTCPDGTTIDNVSTTLSPQDRASLCNGHQKLNCQNQLFFGLVPWYGYFSPTAFDSSCTLMPGLVNKDGSPNQSGINSIWLIALAIFEDVLRIAGVLAFGFVIYGGIRFITSQGEPENTKTARETIINAMIGAAIAMIAAVLVSFVGTSLGAK